MQETDRLAFNVALRETNGLQHNHNFIQHLFITTLRDLGVTAVAKQATCKRKSELTAPMSNHHKAHANYWNSYLMKYLLSHLGISPRMAFQGNASGRPRAKQN